ncbi:hypothetical protein V8F33_011357 [Rhypophila sp. PSN 637]
MAFSTRSKAKANAQAIEATMEEDEAFDNNHHDAGADIWNDEDMDMDIDTISTDNEDAEDNTNNKDNEDKPGSPLDGFDYKPSTFQDSVVDEEHKKKFQTAMSAIISSMHKQALAGQFDTTATSNPEDCVVSWGMPQTIQSPDWSPRSVCTALFESVPDPVLSILGNPDFDESDLLALPKVPPNRQLWGVYLDIPTKRGEIVGAYVGCGTGLVTSKTARAIGIASRVDDHEGVSHRETKGPAPQAQDSRYFNTPDIAELVQGLRDVAERELGHPIINLGHLIQLNHAW